MGRHTVPGSGTPEPDRGFWVRSAVAAVVLVLVAAFFLTRGGDNDGRVGTTGAGRASPSGGAASQTSTPTTAGPTASPSATSRSATASPSPAARPPTLAFTVRYPSYITVRVPGGRTLVSKLFKAGAKARFDQKLLQVVNGRPRAVRFVVNGKPREPGPSDRAETFTVRRK